MLLKGSKHFENSNHLLQLGLAENNTVSYPIAPIANNLKDVNGQTINDHAFTILIAEDNPELRQLVKEGLEKNHHVLQTENGLQCWELATEQIPDLIVSDVMMPEMDGFELCRKLKIDARTSHIPIILLTAKSTQTDHLIGLETGADIYLTKPFNIRLLELSVRNLLASREKIKKYFSKKTTGINILAEEPIANDEKFQHEEIVGNDIVNNTDKVFFEEMVEIVNNHLDDPQFSIPMLCKKVAMSENVLYKKTKALTGMTVNDFIKSLRLKKAAELLQQKQLSINEIAYSVGYSDRKYFSKEFKKQYGKTPTEFSSGLIIPQ